MQIYSVDALESPEQLKDLVRAFLAHELQELHAISDIKLDLNVTLR